jgi:hypothetical protein
MRGIRAERFAKGRVKRARKGPCFLFPSHPDNKALSVHRAPKSKSHARKFSFRLVFSRALVYNVYILS